MNILITGAGGFVGQLLAEQLLNDGHRVLLADIVKPSIPAKANGANAVAVKADLGVAAELEGLITSDLNAVYVLHGVMSAGSEANFSLGYNVNFHATLQLFEALRIRCPNVKVIYSSSTAIYGQPLPDMPSEKTLPTPESSYGTQKLLVEMALNDYTRKDFLQGFSLRLPTISVRPGAPTQAASSWMSGIIREPLQGLPSVLPCSEDFQAWMCSPRTLIRNLTHALTLERDCLPAHQRQVNLPGLTVSVKEMLDALRTAGGDAAVRLVTREEPTPQIRAMLDSWPIRFDISIALELGFVQDSSFDAAVKDFQETLLERREGALSM